MFYIYCSPLDDFYHVTIAQKLETINPIDFFEYDFIGPFTDYDIAEDLAIRENMPFGE